MSDWTFALQATALSLALLWLLLAVAQPRKPALLLVWALFCASLAMLMAKNLAGDGIGAWRYVIGLGACATCNGFWLVSRALFRAERPFTGRHLAYAGLIAALIVAGQLLALLGESPGWISPALRTALDGALDEAVGLLGSAVLVLALWEGVRGGAQAEARERALRAVFLITYGGCVAACTLIPAMVAPAISASVDALVSAAAALTILLVTQGLVYWRLRHPLAASECATRTMPDAPSASVPAQADVEATDAGLDRAEDTALAAALERHMHLARPYLRADLKLVHLAQALDVCEYRISRVVNGVLGQRNVNHYINGYRIAHARTLLRDPDCARWSTLVVGLESGFGSLGQFHRAFKAIASCTPGEYRALVGEARAPTAVRRAAPS